MGKKNDLKNKRSKPAKKVKQRKVRKPNPTHPYEITKRNKAMLTGKEPHWNVEEEFYSYKVWSQDPDSEEDFDHWLAASLDEGNASARKAWQWTADTHDRTYWYVDGKTVWTDNYWFDKV